MIGAVIALRTARNLNVPGHPELPGYGLHDFRDVLYYPAVAVLDGRNPYDPAVFRSAYPVARPLAPYAPTMLMLHVPFALLPFPLAEWTHFAMNLTLMLALAYLALDACGLPVAAAGVFGLGAVILLSRPAHMTLYIGQSSAYLVAATYCALLFAERRPALAGVALAIACAKPTFGIPLCAVLLVRGDRAALVWGLTLAAVAGAVMVAVLAPAAGGLAPLVESIRDSYARLMQDPSANAASSIIRVDAVALVGRLLGGTVGPAAESLATLALLATGTAAVWRISCAGDADARLRSACVACVTILACMYHQSYDGLLLTLPMLALASGRLGDAPVTRLVAFVAMSVPALNYVATDTVVDALGVQGTARAVIGSVNGAALLVAFVAVTMLAVSRRGVARPLVADVAG
jgi:hypothetical protein